jgi:predicted nucleotidyltransferase
VNLAPVLALLERQFPDRLDAAFVYGSVAAGRNHPGSDLDCFVLLTEEPDPVHRLRVGEEFAALQQRLGLTPDPHHPVELFTVGACWSALRSPRTGRLLADAAAGQPPDPADSDEVEIMHAFLDERIELRSSPCLAALTSQAETLVQTAADATRLLRLGHEAAEELR